MIEDRLACKQLRVLIIQAGVPVFVATGPAIGHAWRIVQGYGWHDEGGPLTCLWALNLGAGNRDLCNGAALASATFSQLYTVVPCAAPIVLRSGQTITFNAAAKTAGKNVVIELVVDEIVGEESYVG
jgi:hypothetical protein